MINVKTRIQLVAFVVIAVVGIAYLGWRYVGAASWFGQSGYTVKVQLANAGGLFSNGEVTYRGVTVGRVGAMHLTDKGIVVDAHITSSGTKIPNNVKAAVADRSVIGEQYLDLRPQTDSGPYLAQGSTIKQQDTSLPPPVQQLMSTASSFAASVPQGSLQTVVNELYTATQGAGNNFGTLIDTSHSFFSRADQSLPQTLSLISTSKTVLTTQQNTSNSIQSFSDNLNLLAQQLKSSNGDVNALLQKAGPSLAQTNGLINDLSGTLHGLLTNLLATSQAFLSNKNGLHEIYADLPVAITDAGAVITPNGVNVGVVPTFFNPLPCNSGYGGTHVRTGLNTGGNPALNTGASCTARPGSGVNVRGTQNAPGN